jgi:hypothetical protein
MRKKIETGKRLQKVLRGLSDHRAGKIKLEGRGISSKIQSPNIFNSLEINTLAVVRARDS